MKKYILITIAIIILIFVFKAINDVNEVSSRQDYSQNNFDFEDSLILKKEKLKYMKIETVVKSSLRNAIKFYRYKKLYNLYITKINLQKDISMDNIIYFNEEITSPNSFVVYTGLQSNSIYKIKFRAEKTKPVSKIIFSMAGKVEKLKRVVYNKDFISYYLPLYTFSLQYEDKSNPIDIFVGTDTPRIITKQGVPFIVTFYKKEKSIYLLLITPIEKGTVLDENILSEFIN